METRDLREGMKVYASDGDSLGKIVEVGETTFVIEKGFFFPKEYIARRDQIADMRNGEVWLSLATRELREGAAAQSTETREGRVSSHEEVRIPLAEERLETSTHEREAGSVRVRKNVVTEEQNITVPLRHEEVHVERVPASGEATEATFEKDEVRVPIREEVAEVHTRPVVREEVRVSKTAHEEKEHIRAKTRKETAEVEKDGRRIEEERHRNP